VFKSIRGTLQVWHATILAIALAALVGLMGLNLRRAEIERIDAELQGAALALLAGPDFSREPAHDVREPGEKPALLEAPAQRFLPALPWADSDAMDASSVGDWWWEVVSPTFLKRLQRPGGDAPYYAVWTANGRVIRSSSPEQSVPSDPGAAAAIAAAVANPNHPQPIAREGAREVVVTEAGRYPVRVLVGKSVRSELQAQNRFLLRVVGGGVAILAIGLVGGWLLTRRALRPIAEISETARAISGSHLSGRIPVEETKSELGSLATTLNEAFGRVESAFARQVRFTADASHELRTPLAVIQSHAALALSKPRPPEQYRQALEVCHRAAQRMGGLVESLLALARADARQLAVQPADFELGEVLNECLDLVRDAAGERNLVLGLDLEPVRVRSDRTLVARICVNLLTNAVRYNRDGGFVRVALRRAGNEAVIEVADSGIGIAPEDQHRIYERFFRADPARSGAAGGIGLGLSICQSLVLLLGGTIAFTSEKEVGTVFVVRLPVGLEQPAAGAA
jgi:two-component system OmpR family sensor kinase